jgi:hypothetical protein
MLVLNYMAQPNFNQIIPSLAKALNRMTSPSISLHVIEGATEEIATKALVLRAKDKQTIQLLAKNLVELKISGRPFNEPPTLSLYLKGETNEEGKPKLFQKFQFAKIYQQGVQTKDGAYSIVFSVNQSVDLFIHEIATSPLATIEVRNLPVPKVNLTTIDTLVDPWPDDKPLSLKINASGENPLRFLRLLIRTGSRQSEELVSNIMNEDIRDIEVVHDLVLESFVESDIAEVEIIAEAIDRGIPNPLVGRSQALIVNTASAYGRYRRTLSTLSKLKGIVDQAIGEKKDRLLDDASEIMKQAIEQSNDSPFFDGLDRANLSSFEARVEENSKRPDFEGLFVLSDELNQFLFEHETLDDRERDRDFFVAARSFSRLIEQDHKKRPVEVATVTARMIYFLEGRHQRWTLRVSRLPMPPDSWAEISQESPFLKSMEKISEWQTNHSDPGNQKSLESLSKTVTEYRAWLEELETAEDQARSQAEQERQQGLASSRDQLRELQKRQGQISTYLDKAPLQSQNDLAEGWPSIRMQQNSNIADGKALEAQLRGLSQAASQRMRLTLDAMGETSEAGNKGSFVDAESLSDMAGRLLRQTESDTRNAQNREQSRGKRRRVTGDNYYGQSVVGGDVEIRHEYQVDKRYREDILNEVRGAEVGKENRSLLDDYLRRVVR